MDISDFEGGGQTFLSALFSEQTIETKDYGLPAVICVRKVFFHFDFLSTNSAVVGFWSPYAFPFKIILSSSLIRELKDYGKQGCL